MSRHNVFLKRRGKLLENIFSALGRDREHIAYVILYGSATREISHARDVDLLCVCARRSHPRFIVRSFGNKRLNLHVVSGKHVRDDILHDKYGWIFLTKFLDDFEVLHGKQDAALEMRARAHMRILGQWMSQRGTFRVRTPGKMAAAIIHTLEAWNPQFSEYLNKNKISKDNYVRYARHEFLNSKTFRSLTRRTPNGFSFVRRSPLLRYADLRVVLITYWCLYARYVFEPSRYLDGKIDTLLKFKGIVC